MKIIPHFLLLTTMQLAGFFSNGQTVTYKTTVLLTPDKMPEYKKGMNGWTDFLAAKLDRDLLKKQNAPEGRYVVIASFLVDSVGGVRDIRIEYDRGYGTGDEVIRVIGLTNKKWVPAYDKGLPVTFRHRQSITFVNNKELP